MSAGAISHTRRSDGAPPVAEPAAPGILHIDVAEVAERVGVAVLPVDVIPKRDPLDTFLLEEARKAAGFDLSVLPRRELIAVALREIQREQWWRDRAESDLVSERAKSRDLEFQLAAAGRQLEDLREIRRQVLSIVLELVAFAAAKLGCDPAPDDVLKRVRALRSGLLSGMQPSTASLTALIRGESTT